MRFWDQQAKTPKAAAKALVPAPSLPDASWQCAFCPHFGPDVLIGVCQGCE